MNNFNIRPLLELMGLMLIGMILSGFVSQYFIKLDLASAESNPGKFLLAVAITLILSFGIPSLIWLLVRGSLIPGFDQKSKKPEDYFFSFVLFFACIFFAEYLFTWLTEFLSIRGWTELTEEPFNVQSVQNILKNENALYLTILAVAILPAILEEFFFRRIIFGYLYVQNMQFWPAALLSSLFFAGVHEHFISFFPILLLGLSLSYAYYKTKNIWVPIVLHALNNTLTILAIHWKWDEGFTTHWVTAIISALVIAFIFREKLGSSAPRQNNEIDSGDD